MHGEYSGKMVPFNRASQRAAEGEEALPAMASDALEGGSVAKCCAATNIFAVCQKILETRRIVWNSALSIALALRQLVTGDRR
ncbi:hypothetical protein [Rhizobium sp. AC44/96]|uniref:hypothetical protein n=1 Tax=Rhizobium sp. AC44/96 TaxID=1841654 RepID=UPI0011472D1B|nr:hypothetical protein [Rhizobium sp. AC44/96]